MQGAKWGFQRIQDSAMPEALLAGCGNPALAPGSGYLELKLGKGVSFVIASGTE
jgi:hypothetical protein